MLSLKNTVRSSFRLVKRMSNERMTRRIYAVEDTGGKARVIGLVGVRGSRQATNKRINTMERNVSVRTKGFKKE